MPTYARNNFLAAMPSTGSLCGVVMRVFLTQCIAEVVRLLICPAATDVSGTIRGVRRLARSFDA